MLAALSTAAAVAQACSSNPKPEPVQKEAGDDKARDGGAREKAKQGLVAREKYYRDKARKEGKTFEEVAPARVVAAAKAREADAKDPKRATPERAAYYKERDGDAKADAKAAAGRAPAQHDANHAKSDATLAAAGEGRFAPIDGDPPYVDGYNPEEETCVSGNWCADKSAVLEVSVPNVGEDEALACPQRITGARRRDDPFPKGKAFKGLSDKATMQGALNGHGTTLARERGASDDTCCYHWFEYCSGRPHVGEDGPVLAATMPGRAWHHDAPARDGASVRQRIADLPNEVRGRLAASWTEDALMEHASIAAFARATLELMAVGAPPDLVAGCQRAALDEVDHTRRCFSLATRYGAPAQQPGALEPLPPRAGGKAQLVADTFAEGCVGETIAALVAERAARRCEDPEVGAALAVIAKDEAQHAALAWATVEWAIATGPGDVADALRSAVRRLRPPSDEPAPEVDPEANRLARFGRLDAHAQRQAKHDAWRDIIEPMLASMLSDALAQRRKTTAWPTLRA